MKAREFPRTALQCHLKVKKKMLFVKKSEMLKSITGVADRSSRVNFENSVAYRAIFST